MMKKLLVILCGLFVSTAYASVLDDCVQKIAANDELWQQRLFDKKDGIFSFLSDTDELTDDIVQSNKNKIYTLLGADVLLNCRDNLADISKTPRGLIPFKRNNTEYAFDFGTQEMFDYIDMRTGFLVINKRNLKSGDVVQLSDIPKKQKFFSDECSDWTIADNLDDDAEVNKAGQAVFNEFGGSKNEFFLDFADGDNRRAFPGLVLMDKTASTKETIVTYRNLRVAMEKMQQFGEKLKTSQCANQGLALYLVALDVQKDTTNAKVGWKVAAGVGGGAMAWLGATYAIATFTTVSNTAIVASGIAALSLGPIGWIVGGAAVATATAIALYPSQIQDIKQVMILDGPYIL